MRTVGVSVGNQILMGTIKRGEAENTSPRQTVEKTNEFRQFDKSFGRAFLKARAVKGA